MLSIAAAAEAFTSRIMCLEWPQQMRQLLGYIARMFSTIVGIRRVGSCKLQHISALTSLKLFRKEVARARRSNHFEGLSTITSTKAAAVYHHQKRVT